MTHTTKKLFLSVMVALCIGAALGAVTGLAHASTVDMLAPLLHGLAAAPSALLLATLPAAGVLSDTADETAATAAAQATAAAAAEADAAAHSAAAAKAASKKVKARVLFAGAFGQVNDVVLVDAATAKAGVAAGELDPDKGAVAYAESLAAK